MHKFILVLECLMGCEHIVILVLSGQVQSFLIYNDLPIGTMSSLRKDSKQHRSITAPLGQNQTEARQQNYWTTRNLTTISKNMLSLSLWLTNPQAIGHLWIMSLSKMKLLIQLGVENLPMNLK